MTTKVDICNNALDLMGQGLHIKTFEDNTKEADLCRRLYELTIQRALSKYNWSFARKDEVITDTQLTDKISLPWKFTYHIPADVMKILYLEHLEDNRGKDCINKKVIDFNFRLIGSERYLVTNEPAPFVMQYQSFVTDVDLFSVGFIEGVEYLLASRFATALIHGATGVQISTQLMQAGLQFLDIAAGQDAQQGIDSIRDNNCSIINARYGRAL